jgi:peptidyl-prolyl cis-trans isomerase SurA
MKKALIPVWAIVMLLGTLAPARAGDVLDRIVATVNGHIVLQSDWDDAVRYEAFIAGRLPAQVTMADRKAALDRLIDQELLREQMQSSDFPRATPEEIGKSIAQVRGQYPGAATESGWQSILSRYRLTEKELRDHIALRLDLMRLVDARLRPTVNIDAKSIESYYNQELLPQLRQEGAKALPLGEVSPRIKELLTQRKVNQLLLSWLQDLRAGSDIRTNLNSTASGDRSR